MGCGSSAVSPSINKNNEDVKPRKHEETPVEVIAKADNNSKLKSSENVRPSSSGTKLLIKRQNSHNGNINSSTESPKTGVKVRKLVRDSRGSVRPASASSTSSEVERQFSGDTRKREDTGTLFQASSLSTQEKPPLPPIGGGTVQLKPLAFEVPLDTKQAKMGPPRRLQSLKNPPRPLTQQDIEEKLKQSNERRELEIQRKKLKSSRMSRRKREIIAAREQSKIEEQTEEIREKMNATASNKERLQAEAIEKQRRKHEHAMKVRERAKQLKQRKDLDEGLGNEIETYKATSDDEGESSWSTTEIKSKSLIKTKTSTSIESHASVDTNDSGVPNRLKDDSTDKLFNA